MTGDYEVAVKFNEEHIPDSPFVVTAAPNSDAARRLTVSSLQVRLRERGAHGPMGGFRGASAAPWGLQGSIGAAVGPIGLYRGCSGAYRAP